MSLLLLLSGSELPPPVIEVVTPRVSMRVDLALGGSYRQEVMDDAPVGWWRFSERSGNTARDSSGFGRHGTIGGGVTLGVESPNPESGGAFTFDGTTGYVTMGDVTAFEFVGAFSVECWIKKSANPGTYRAIVRKRLLNTVEGWEVDLMPAGTIQFALSNATNTNNLFVTVSGVLSHDVWHHVVCTWDGTTAANGVKTYVDGTLSVQDTSTGSVGGVAASSSFFIGAGTTVPDLPFPGEIDEVAVYPQALSAADVLRHYAAGFWTDVSADLVAEPGLDLTFGIGSDGPLDRLADAGVLSFTLRNDAGNSGGVLGYYSPQSPNVRTGFRQGVLVRVVFATDSGSDVSQEDWIQQDWVQHGGVVEYPRFMGKIVSIDPVPGRFRSRRTAVVAQDLMADLIEADLRNVTLQIGQLEDVLIQTVMEAVPIVAQPLALTLDAGLDVSPYAFDKLGSGDKAYTPLSQLIISSLGFGSIDASGVFRYENRQTRQLAVSQVSFDDDMTGLVTPSTLDGVFNHVRVVFHPKTIDTAATTVLWSETGVPPPIGPAETIEIWGTYFNPALTMEAIGGTAQVAPVATTDYLANTLADGSGVNKTANVTVTAVPFASTVKFTITNNDAAAIFLTKLQIRGKGLYDKSPVTVESFLSQPYGDRALTVDLPYQSDYTIAASLAEYIRVQYENPTQQVTSFVFQAERSEAFLMAALSLQIGDRVTVSETVTGLELAAVFVHSIHLHVIERTLITCELGVSSASFFAGGVWIMDDVDLSLAGTSTVFAYA